jgi:hypothetical protein
MTNRVGDFLPASGVVLQGSVTTTGAVPAQRDDVRLHIVTTERLRDEMVEGFARSTTATARARFREHDTIPLLTISDVAGFGPRIRSSQRHPQIHHPSAQKQIETAVNSWNIHAVWSI